MEDPRAGGARLDILRTLLKQELSASGLAERLGVSPAAIRQHLATLEALGLVSKRKLVTRPSRPTFLYRPSPDGMRAFPKRYDLMLRTMLERLLERDGPEAVARIVSDVAHRVAERARPQVSGLPAGARWEFVLDWLEREFAWQAEVETEASGERRVTIHQCPFQDLPRTPFDACGVFFTTLMSALGGDAAVEHVEAVKTPACCAFVVAPGAS